MSNRMNPSGAPPIQAGGPPMMPGAASKSAWPTVFGVIGIVLASLGILGGICTPIWALVIPKFADWMERQTPQSPGLSMPSMTDMLPPTWWLITSSLVGLVISVWLLAGAVDLVKRRPRGVARMKTWAWIQIGWALVSTAVSIPIQMNVAGQMPQAPMVGTIGAATTAVGVIFGLAYAAALPVVFLVWTGRGNIKQEIAQWGDDRRVSF